jgi:hypothetical protein
MSKKIDNYNKVFSSISLFDWFCLASLIFFIVCSVFKYFEWGNQADIGVLFVYAYGLLSISSFFFTMGFATRMNKKKIRADHLMNERRRNQKGGNTNANR